jgi:pimeloyl-ACP methyl ester carboxylesterase
MGPGTEPLGRSHPASPIAVRVPTGDAFLDGDLVWSEDPTGGLVVFAHGSGSSRFSSRNRFVAEELRLAGLGTLLMDLLTPEEEAVDVRTRHLRFDIPMLARRVVATLDWLRGEPAAAACAIGLFGSSTGAAAALIAAAERPDVVSAVVSRGGRSDLAGGALPRVRAPTLLVVGAHDLQVLDLNEQARAAMRSPVELVVIPGATHLFEEPGKLEDVAKLAAEFFRKHLNR